MSILYVIKTRSEGAIRDFTVATSLPDALALLTIARNETETAWIDTDLQEAA